MAHVSDQGRIRTVLDEQQPVKAVVGFCSEFQQLRACAAAAHYGSVHIQEIARECAAEQSADLH